MFAESKWKELVAEVDDATADTAATDDFKLVVRLVVGAEKATGLEEEEEAATTGKGRFPIMNFNKNSSNVIDSLSG